MKPFTTAAMVLSVLWVPMAAFSGETSTMNKNVTIISGQATADGKSEVRERVLDECIVSLPKAEDLEAVVTSEPKYLKEINGNAAQNDFVKTYSAVIELNYMLYQKVLFIVTTNSVPAVEPNMKVMEKSIPQTKRFESNFANGDSYAGRSRREYYFSTSEGAVADARKQAQIWLKQQAAVECKQSQSK
jgi:hypothetical protein